MINGYPLPDHAFWLQAIPTNEHDTNWRTYGVYSDKKHLSEKVSELKDSSYIIDGSINYQYLPMYMILEIIKKEGVDDKIIISKGLWYSIKQLFNFGN